MQTARGEEDIVPNRDSNAAQESERGSDFREKLSSSSSWILGQVRWDEQERRRENVRLASFYFVVRGGTRGGGGRRGNGGRAC
ncbi:unnamed protein product [Sphagnum jensenii]